MIPIDSHLFALYIGTNAACEILDLLPETDLTQELSEIINIQFSIISNIISHRHFGNDNLDDFIKHCEHLIDQVERVSHESKD